MLTSADPAAVSVSGCSATEAGSSKAKPNFRAAASPKLQFNFRQNRQKAARRVSGVARCHSDTLRNPCCSLAAKDHSPRLLVLSSLAVLQRFPTLTFSSLV